MVHFSDQGVVIDVTGRPITFRRGIPFLLLVLGLVLVEAIGSRILRYAWDPGPIVPVVESNATAAVVSLVILGLAWFILNHEGVTGTEIGLSSGLILPAIVAVAGYFLALNVAAAVFAIASGNPATIGYYWTVSPPEAAVYFLWMLVIAGLVEEFLFRGYIQTKCIALLGDDHRTRVGLGIVITSLLFSAYHVPRILIDGAPGGMGPFDYLLLLAINGIAFGLLYEWTHNLYVPILIHAAGNMPGTAGILFFTTTGWPTWATIGYAISYLGLIVGMILVYRHWAFTTGWMPVWSERRVARSPTRSDGNSHRW